MEEKGALERDCGVDCVESEAALSVVLPLRRGLGGGGGFFFVESWISVSEAGDEPSWFVGGVDEADEKFRRLDGLLGLAGGACNFPSVSPFRESSEGTGRL